MLDLLVESETYPIRADGLTSRFAVMTKSRISMWLSRWIRRINACLFALNRDLESERELVLKWQDPAHRVLDCKTLTGSDLKAANTFERPMMLLRRI